MAKRRHKKAHKKDKYWDPPIWVEGHKLNEKTGEMEPVKFKLKRSCSW